MEEYFQVQITNKVESEKNSKEIVDVLYFKVKEGKIVKGIRLSSVHPSLIETSKLEIKDLNRDMYEHREQILEKRLNNSK